MGFIWEKLSDFGPSWLFSHKVKDVPVVIGLEHSITMSESSESKNNRKLKPEVLNSVKTIQYSILGIEKVLRSTICITNKSPKVIGVQW